jgi:RNA polymerase primary sigma factor
MDQITKTYVKELRNNNSTQEETLNLIQKSRQGDEAARETLIHNYLLLVVKVARQYLNMGVPLGDLISEGNIGLITAIEKFDPAKGIFSSYAQYWIKQAIIRNCIHKRRLVRLPENISELMRTDRWNGINYREFSIDTPNEEGDSMAEDIADSSEFSTFVKEEDAILKNKAERILSFLHTRDAEIVKACYGIDREEPLEIVEVAELFNLSTTRINQILRNSIKKMRIEYNSLPEAKTKEVEIISAKYGTEDKNIDVTDKVVDLYLAKENIKSCNKLGGDPCPGLVKALTVQYIYGESILVKVFSEGSVVKF